MSSSSSENNDLLPTVVQQTSEIIRLKDELTRSKDDLAHLKYEIAHLKEENTHLRDENARLRLKRGASAETPVPAAEPAVPVANTVVMLPPATAIGAAPSVLAAETERPTPTSPVLAQALPLAVGGAGIPPLAQQPNKRPRTNIPTPPDMLPAGTTVYTHWKGIEYEATWRGLWDTTDLIVVADGRVMSLSGWVWECRGSKTSPGGWDHCYIKRDETTIKLTILRHR